MALPPPPMATPLSPTPGAGTEAQARIELSNAVRSLIKALGVLKDVSSEEAKACLTALRALEKVAPDVDEGVSQTEAKTLLQSAESARPGMGAGIGPRPPSPMSVAGMPFGMNSQVPSPGIG